MAAPRWRRPGALAVDGRRSTGDRRAPAASTLGLPRPARDGRNVGDGGRSRPVAGAPPARPPDPRRDHPHDPRWLLAGRGRRDARSAARHRRQLDLPRPRPPPCRTGAASMTDLFDLELRDRLGRLVTAVPIEASTSLARVVAAPVRTRASGHRLVLGGLVPVLAVLVVGILLAGIARFGPFGPGATEAPSSSPVPTTAT